MKSLNGKVILVTGASGGIGSEISQRLAKEGAHVAVTDINLDAAADVAEKLSSESMSAAAYALDVCDEQQWQKVSAAIKDKWGTWDGLVNNAGIPAPVESVADQSLATWQRTMEVNLNSVFLGIRSAMQEMSTGGAVVNIASVGGYVSMPNSGAYCASKAGVISITRTASKEAALRANPIRINAICPGFVATEMAKNVVNGHFGDSDAAMSAFMQSLPLGPGKPADVAATVAFLLSSDSSWTTGAAFVVDGGMHP